MRAAGWKRRKTMIGRRALISTWRAVVRGLTIAGWAEKGSYYSLTAADELTTPA